MTISGNSDRCPAESDGRHRWEAAQPPDWMDTDDWRDPEWDDWYDQARQRCYSCGQYADE